VVKTVKSIHGLELMASISKMTKQSACIKLVEVHRFENEFDSVIILYNFMNTIVLKPPNPFLHVKVRL